ncbi:hypothetical protein KKG71_04090 [Patescibacteria group bacterium]|nr:hypothetical protein [Patescibacteria group bacterium]
MKKKEGQLDKEGNLPEKNETTEERIKKKELVRRHSDFYVNFINYLLKVTNGTDKRDHHEAFEELIIDLPKKHQDSYRIGFEKLLIKLKLNHTLFQSKKGQEAFTIMTALLKESEDANEILEKMEGNVRFIEPTIGVFILEAEKNFFSLLQTKDIIPNAGQGIFFGSSEADAPAFLMLQRLSLAKSLKDDSEKMLNNSFLRHETHHLIWKMLKDGDYVEPTTETNEEKAKAFDNYRDEVVAYFLQNRSLSEADPENLIYSEGEDLITEADRTTDFIILCLQFGELNGLEKKDFIYPTMRSNSFENLRKRYLELVFPIELNLETMKIIWKNWNAPSIMFPEGRDNVGNERFLKMSNLHIGSREAEIFIESELMNSDDLAYIMDKMIDKLLSFLKWLSIEDKVDVMKIYRSVVAKRLLLPEKTRQIILALPTLEYHGIILLGKQPAEFLKKYLNIDKAVRDPDARRTFSQIIHSDPVMEEAFDKIKNKKLEDALKWDKSEDMRKEEIERIWNNL